MLHNIFEQGMYTQYTPTRCDVNVPTRAGTDSISPGRPARPPFFEIFARVGAVRQVGIPLALLSRATVAGSGRPAIYYYG
jgi:hypothetical protein